MENNSLVIFFDGSCGPTNPGGNIGAGVVFYHATNFGFLKKETKSMYDSIKKIHTISEKHKFGENNFNYTTNNIAEHYALYLGLKHALTLDYKKISVFGDSKMVINQMAGIFSIDRTKPYGKYATDNMNLKYELLEKDRKLFFNWIPRELNSIADELSK